MDITLRQLISMNKLNGLRLIAGESGLDRVVKSVGLLDYEYDPALKEIYRYSNFRENQLILSSFLYAKDCPFLIPEAVKQLATKRISGLIIKNVFRIPLPGSLLRYADSKKLPLFIQDRPEPFFEDLVLSINSCITHFSDISQSEQKIDQLINAPYTSDSIIKDAYALFSSLLGYYFVLYFFKETPLTLQDYNDLLEQYRTLCFPGTQNAIFKYHNGVIVISSTDNFDRESAIKRKQAIIDALIGTEKGFHVGSSFFMYTTSDFREAIWESIWAALLAHVQQRHMLNYKDIGIYQFVLPFVKEPYMQQTYRSTILDRVVDFDVENNTHLYETLSTIIKENGNVRNTAELLAQHENSIRYRLERVKDLVGLDYRKADDYALMNFSVKLRTCTEEYAFYNSLVPEF